MPGSRTHVGEHSTEVKCFELHGPLEGLHEKCMRLADFSTCLKTQPVTCPYRARVNHPFYGDNDYTEYVDIDKNGFLL